MQGIKVTSMEPLDDGLRKYNKLYWIIGGIAFVIGLPGGGLTGGIFIGLLGIAVAYTVKICIADLKLKGLRKYSFLLPDYITNDQQLLDYVIGPLTRLGMDIEKNSDGSACIHHNGLMYDVIINSDHTFTLWWRKSVLGAMFNRRSAIFFYRKAVVSMGIIAYHIQDR